MARVILHEYCCEARQLIESRAYDAAIAICRQILKRYPKHVETYRLLGEACLEKGELNEATDIFKRLLSADPENFAAYAGLGVIYEERQQLVQAIWHMERAFELAPNNEEIRNALRRLYGQRDGAEPARIKLNKVALARLYSRGGQYRQAIEEFNRSLEIEPKRMDIRLSLAETLWRDGRREQAAEVAREILKTCPDCLKAILLLGAIQMDKGHADEGKQILARARTLDPENRVAQTLFGDDSPLSIQPVLVPRALDQPMPVWASTEPAASESAASTVPELEAELATALAQETEQPETPLPETPLAQTTNTMPAAVPTAVTAEEAYAAPEAEAFPVGHAWAGPPPEAPATSAAETITEAAAAAPEAIFPVQEAPPTHEALEASVAVPLAERAEAPAAPIPEAAALQETQTSLEAPEALVLAPVPEPTESLATPTLEPASAQEAQPATEALEAPVALPLAEQAEAPAAPILEAAPVQALPVPEAPETPVTAPAAEQAEALAPPTPEEAAAEEPEPAQAAAPAKTVSTVPADDLAATTGTTPSEAAAVPQEAATPQPESGMVTSTEELVESVVTPPAEVASPTETVHEHALVVDELAPTAISAIQSRDVEHYEQQLQQNPKDERARLNLARIYRDQEQVELALEQYRALAKAKSETLAEAIEDMESIVASRPGNLAAHELLADLYTKNGQLQNAMERYRWLRQQVEQKPA